jgi:hypothetical protein
MRTYDEIVADAADERVFSNSTEYEIWANTDGCYDCLNDDAATEKYCPILGAMLMGKWPTEIERAPHEWQDREGKTHSYEAAGKCSEFDRRPDDDGGGDDDPEPDPGPPPVIDGQIDMFEVFADRIADEATSRQPIGAHR